MNSGKLRMVSGLRNSALALLTPGYLSAQWLTLPVSLLICQPPFSHLWDQLFYIHIRPRSWNTCLSVPFLFRLAQWSPVLSVLSVMTELHPPPCWTVSHFLSHEQVDGTQIVSLSYCGARFCDYVSTSLCVYMLFTDMLNCGISGSCSNFYKNLHTVFLSLLSSLHLFFSSFLSLRNFWDKVLKYIPGWSQTHHSLHQLVRFRINTEMNFLACLWGSLLIVSWKGRLHHGLGSKAE